MSSTILDVPYHEKNQVKKLGARWNPKLKKWVVSSEQDIKPFAKWLPPKPHLKLLPPVYLAQAIHPYPCPTCKATNVVYTFAASGVENLKYSSQPEIISQFGILTTIKLIPELLAEFLEVTCKGFYIDEYQETKAYFNHCHVCQTLIGKGYLSSPYRAFLPDSQYEAQNITLFGIPDTVPIAVNAVYLSRPETERIEQFAQRKSLKELK